MAYETAVVAKNCTVRVRMQLMDDGSEPPERLGITLPEFTKHLGLFLEYIKDRIRAVATIDLVGGSMVTMVISNLFGVLGQGKVEERIESGVESYISSEGNEVRGEARRRLWKGGW